MSALEYKLNNTDMLFVAQVGAMRNIRGLSKGYKHRAGMIETEEAEGWGRHIEGAASEFVVAKYLGLHWGVDINAFQDGDLEGIDVKSTTHESGRLIVKPGDNSDLIYVLVVGKVPSLRIIGWAYGHEAMQDRYLTKLDRNRPETYAMPQRELHSMSELRRLIWRQALERLEAEEVQHA